MPVTTITIKVEDTGTSLHIGGAAPAAITEATSAATGFEEAPPPGLIGEAVRGLVGEAAVAVEGEGPPPQDLSSLSESLEAFAVDTTAAPPPEELVEGVESDEESIAPMPVEDLDKKPATRAKKS